MNLPAQLMSPLPPWRCAAASVGVPCDPASGRPQPFLISGPPFHGNGGVKVRRWHS